MKWHGKLSCYSTFALVVLAFRFGLISRVCSIHLLRNAHFFSMLFILTRKIGIKNRIYTHNVFVHYGMESVSAMAMRTTTTTTSTTSELFIFACVFGQIAHSLEMDNVICKIVLQRKLYCEVECEWRKIRIWSSRNAKKWNERFRENSWLQMKREL